MKILVEMKAPGLQNKKNEQVFEYEPINTLNHLLKVNQHMLAAFSENIEARYALSFNDFRVIMMLGQHGEIASHEIAEHTGMPVMGISRAVNALEKRGLVVRKVDAANRRRKPISLSEEGKSLFEKTMPTTLGVAKYLFESLRVDEILSFDHYLQVLTQRFTETDENGELEFVKQTRPSDDIEST